MHVGPHAALSPVTHWPVAQHPTGQLVVSQTQPVGVQCSPAAQRAPPLVEQTHAPVAEQESARASQAWHALPAGAHCAAVRGVTHAVPEQHPAGHDVASQMHPVAVQRCPAAQTAPPLQPHAPAAEQVLAAIPQFEQVVPTFGVGAQYAEVVGAWHAPLALSQQPLGQVLASHTQLPAG